MGRPGLAKEIISVCMFLARGESPFRSGVEFIADGAGPAGATLVEA